MRLVLASLVKRLAGCKWGCSGDTLTSAYKLYIKPVFPCCNEVLVSASESTINKFQIPNQAMGFITVSVNAVPIAAMRSLTGFLQ